MKKKNNKKKREINLEKKITKNSEKTKAKNNVCIILVRKYCNPRGD